MRKLFGTGFVVALLVFLLLQTIVPSVTAQEGEIAYDNGTPAASVSLPYSPREWAGGVQEVNEQWKWTGNTMLAVRFTPDNSTLQTLLGVRFFLTGTLHSFDVWFLDNNRQFMSLAVTPGPSQGSRVGSYVIGATVTPTSIGWVYLNVTDKYSIFLADDFYVAIEFTVAQQPSLGVDTTGPRSNRGWFVDNETMQGWIPYSAYAEQHGLPDGNLMIRAVTAPVACLPPCVPRDVLTGTTTTSTSLTQAWHLPAAVALAILLVTTVGVWQARKRRVSH